MFEGADCLGSEGVEQVVEPEYGQLGALGGADEPAAERDAADRLPGLASCSKTSRVAWPSLEIRRQRSADVDA